MPVAASNIWNILYSVARYLFPVLAVLLVLLLFFYFLSESRIRREKLRMLPGSGTIGELIVLSGGKNLDVNTWFPVPREGVMGAVRSCDLVIPCSGVHPKHLDFSWKDGVGLLVFPRSGCEALVNGVQVTCRNSRFPEPLTHGSVLQVGSAVLRLHLFSALDNTVVPVTPYSETALPEQAVVPPSYTAPGGSFSVPPSSTSSTGSIPAARFSSNNLQQISEPIITIPPVNTSSPDPTPTRPRRSDRWKEDLGE